MVITIFNLKNNEQIYTDECEGFCFQSFLYQHSDKLNDLVSVHFTSDEWDKSDDGERQYCSMTAKEFRHKHSYTEKEFFKTNNKQ